jgi:mannose-6-phosphate isomerase-like protein (cupin superfamily)
VKAGELVFVAKNEWHGFQNTGSTPLKAIFGYLGAHSLEGGGYELPD